MQKVVLITGTSSGMGKVTSEFLAAKGYKVYASMRNTTTKNADVAKELNQLKDVSVIDIDVTDNTSVDKAIQQIISQEGKLDILINNAGFTAFGITESYTEEDFQKIIEVNLKGPWRMMRATLPYFRKQKDGLIINISSGGGRFAVPFNAMYCSTKFALEGLIEGLYYELKNLGIETILVQPGTYQTGLIEKFLPGSNPDVVEEYGPIAQIPNKMAEGLRAVFESGQMPSVSIVPEKILKLIETPKGERPLRSVFDVTPKGQALADANQYMDKQGREFLKAFGFE